MAARNLQKQIRIGGNAIRKKDSLDLQLTELKELYEISGVNPNKPITNDMVWDAIVNAYKAGISVGIREGKRLSTRAII